MVQVSTPHLLWLQSYMVWARTSERGRTIVSSILPSHSSATPPHLADGDQDDEDGPEGRQRLHLIPDERALALKLRLLLLLWSSLYLHTSIRLHDSVSIWTQ